MGTYKLTLKNADGREWSREIESTDVADGESAQRHARWVVAQHNSAAETLGGTPVEIVSIAYVSPVLRPCPFCGSTDIRANSRAMHVTCGNCEADGPVSAQGDGAGLWNRRAS
jgi:Lar family restriction alleviation protein